MPFEATLFGPVSGESGKVLVRENLRIDPLKGALAEGGWDRESIQIAWPDEGGTGALTSQDPGARSELA